MVLKSAEAIKELLPSFNKIALETIEDSIALGQLMISHGVIKQLTADTGMN